MSLTPHHAKYFAHDLTRLAATGMERLSMALFDAAVDLNPHQIEAALFARQSPLSKGVILADEVGLGKTIEAGIVLCQFWAERKRRLVVICPASLRKQWAMELEEKFNLPVQVLDAKAYREAQRTGRAPLNEKAVLVLSMNYANALREELKSIVWDLVVIDEAHKLRNAYRPSNKVGQGIRWATEDCRKLLLTATPLQNSLLELYGLSTLIDEHLFGDLNSFRTQYASAGSSISDLRQRLSGFCKRTLRNQVTEYIRYTERRTITRPFTPSDDEHALYEAVSGFLQREDSYALPQRQRHLTALILRKLLASSSLAIAATLDKLRTRLETLRDEKVKDDAEFTEGLIEAEELEDDLLDEILSEPDDVGAATEPRTIDRQKLRDEIDILQRLADWARSVGTDTKTKTLLTALDIGFAQMETTGVDGLKEQYILRYMLDVETRGSQSLLNVQAFTDPTAYKLKVKRPGSDEAQEVNVDLLETFNWLIGITVRHIAAPQTFSAGFQRDSEKRLRLKGRLKQDADGPYWFRTVTGSTPDDRRALIIWRKLTGEPEQDNLVLDEWFTRQGYSARDSEFDLIYVNGGNNLENLKTPDDLWKVRLIEEDFHRLMFEAEGV